MMASEPKDEEVMANAAPTGGQEDGKAKRKVDWRAMLGNRKNRSGEPSSRTSMSEFEQALQKRPERWTMGILNDPETDEVPGSVLLLSKVSEYNEPLGLRNAPARTSASSLPSPYPPTKAGSLFRRKREPEKKRTPDGKFVLDPQPSDSANDPLNWKVWRRDTALLSLGFYCMLGGGMTPILAAGFNQVAADLHISEPSVALTTGLYMLGLGLGSVLLSPTAILYGKRPVYLCAAVCFILTSVWCALSPNFASLVVARICMGIAVSSVECLPSATVAEIFFLHEKAYRLGIYTLLLLGGKNLVPLVSAAIINSLGWRWVFWIVAMIVGFGLTLLFFFVPETFWDRTPRPHRYLKRQGTRESLTGMFRTASWNLSPTGRRKSGAGHHPETAEDAELKVEKHAHFQAEHDGENLEDEKSAAIEEPKVEDEKTGDAGFETPTRKPEPISIPSPIHPVQSAGTDYFNHENLPPSALEAQTPSMMSPTPHPTAKPPNAYTTFYQEQPPKTFVQSLKPWNGRIRQDKWIRVACRPFILFCYPSILWSTMVYSLSVGWLIVLSESVATIYENRKSYNFTPLQTGLVYISPFVGGVLGTVVAGKVSDVIVRALSRRNGGVYEPEFRLIMGVPIAIFTTIGLMGYGWSAQERDLWIVPTIFFGFISFGCSLGSTTAITFAVDSYRQYAGEALVTLNFSKNIFHGLMFSLFFNKWLNAEGSKEVFLAIGGIQLACLFLTIPMYIYGKRARMWTVRKNLMEKY